MTDGVSPAAPPGEASAITTGLWTGTLARTAGVPAGATTGGLRPAVFFWGFNTPPPLLITTLGGLATAPDASTSATTGETSVERPSESQDAETPLSMSRLMVMLDPYWLKPVSLLPTTTWHIS